MCLLFVVGVLRLLNEATSCREPVRQSRLPKLALKRGRVAANNNNHPPPTLSSAHLSCSLLHSLSPSTPTLVHPEQNLFSFPRQAIQLQSTPARSQHILTLPSTHSPANMHSRLIFTGLATALAAISRAQGAETRMFITASLDQQRSTDNFTSC